VNLQIGADYYECYMPCTCVENGLDTAVEAAYYSDNEVDSTELEVVI
jgi:hypothetical protein